MAESNGMTDVQLIQQVGVKRQFCHMQLKILFCFSSPVLFSSFKKCSAKYELILKTNVTKIHNYFLLWL